MFIVPRIDRARRRDLVRAGCKTGDVATLKRFYAVALLGAGKSSPTVADILCLAVSTVVRAAHAYLVGGVEGLHDKRLRNGRPKADGAFRTRVTSLLHGTPEDFGWRRPTWTRSAPLMRRDPSFFRAKARSARPIMARAPPCGRSGTTT